MDEVLYAVEILVDEAWVLAVLPTENLSTVKACAKDERMSGHQARVVAYRRAEVVEEK